MGRSDGRGSTKQEKSRSKTRGSKKYFHYHKEHHFRKDYPKRKQWLKQHGVEALVAKKFDDSYTLKVVVFSTSKHEEELVLDSKCCFPHKFQ